jgi:hypothetical protein
MERSGAVWNIPTQSFPDAHFATYPEKLVEPMIKAGCPEFICTECGKAREKIYNREATNHIARADRQIATGGAITGGVGKNFPDVELSFIGYTDCGCGAEFRPGVVWDPFVGSGTTLQVAARLGRNYGGSELKPEYIEMAERRIMVGETGISVKEQQQGQQALFK